MNNSRDNVKVELVCNCVLRMKSPKGAICVGYTSENPPPIPSYDVIHLCLLRLEDLYSVDMRKEEKRCPRKGSGFSATPQEATDIGVSLIRAAAFSLRNVERTEGEVK